MQLFHPNHMTFQSGEDLADFLTSVLWTNPGYMYVKDTQLRYVTCNKNFAHAAGLDTPNDIMGKTDFDLAWGATEAEHYRATDQAILEGHSQLNYEDQQLQSDGMTKSILANKVPIMDAQGNILGIVGNYIDITDRKKAEQSLQTAKDLSDSDNKNKSELVANVSHDLRTPLSAILGMTEAAILSKNPQLYLETLEGVYDSGKHLLRLIEDILNLSSVEHASGEKPSIFSLSKFINSIRLAIESNATQKGLQLIIDNQCRPQQMICGDKTALRRIIINLLGNAIKFTKTGHVTLTIFQGPPSGYSPDLMTLHIKVSDTGIGIHQQDLDKIFERFSRLSPSEISSQSSSGLGLTITQQLLLKMHGTITVDSTVGEGTTFHCKIPLEFIDQPMPDKPASSIVLNQPKTQRPLNILVVEDIKPVRRAMKMLLDLIKAESTFAVNGEEAIEIAINDFDIVFMDLGLGGITGIEATTILRQKHGDSTPIVALTAHASEEDRARCLAAGMNAFLTKPVSIDALKAVLKQFHLFD